MKMKAFASIVAATLSLAASADTETWRLTKPSAWARIATNVSYAVRTDGAVELHRTGERDWTLNGRDGE